MRQAEPVAVPASPRVRPSHLKMEASVRCQLRCPSCPTTEGLVVGARGRGWMDPEDFERLLDQNPQVREVELSNYGEMFLNPRFVDLLRIAHARGVRLTARNGTNFNHKLSWDPSLGAREHDELLRDEVGAAFRAEFREAQGRVYLEEMCLQLWEQPQVHWDGTVLGCGRNFWGDFGGNAFTEGLDAALHHERMVYARAMLRGEVPARDDVPCTRCEIYQDRRAAGRWVREPTPVGRWVERARQALGRVGWLRWLVDRVRGPRGRGFPV